MLSRRNVHAIITEIIAKLDTYLSHYTYFILSETKLKKGYSYLNFNQHHQWVREVRSYPYSALCNDGKYIAFENCVEGIRKSKLTLHRMKNIYNIRLELNKHLTALGEEKTEALAKRIDTLHGLLELGITSNKQLSIDYAVTHITYEDGRLAGHGIFASWWNSTWTQSRAGRALEESLFLLDDFKRKFVQIIPIPSAPPPAYSVNMGVTDSDHIKLGKKI